MINSVRLGKHENDERAPQNNLPPHILFRWSGMRTLWRLKQRGDSVLSILFVLVVWSGLAVRGQVIFSVLPNEGSPNGGAKITLQGTGFPDPSSSNFYGIFIDFVECEVDAATWTPWTMSCTTPPHEPGSFNVTLRTPAGAAPCTGSCMYTYDSGT